MIDRGAFRFVPGDITGLFRRLNGAPMYDILDTLDALLKEQRFYPNFGAYRAQLDSARIYVHRMEVAMSAVLAKNASRQTGTTWEHFQAVQDFKLRPLPADQQRDVGQYWAAGPTPGLRAGTAPVDPAVATVSWEKYVDQFTECTYDVNYKVTNYFSTTLQVKYADGASLELDIETDFSLHQLTPPASRDAMARGSLGRGGRVFPTVLTARTVPRLWAARAEAFRIQEEAFNDFATLAVTGVTFVLMVPAMPAGAMVEEAAVASTRVTRRPVPAGVNRPPPTGWPNEVDFKTVQQVLEGRSPASQLSRDQARRAAAYYRQIAGRVKGARAADAKAFNLERARFLEEGGKVPPGKLNDFVKRAPPR